MHFVNLAVAAALLSLSSIVIGSTPASAWSEANCQSQCRARMPNDVAGCYIQFNCVQYRGKPAVAASKESGAVDRWLKKKNQ